MNFLLAGGLASALLYVATASPSPRLIWNVSGSAPLGPYWIAHRPAQRGEFVASWLPTEVADFAARRGYLPTKIPVIKRLAAAAGNVVCSDGLIIEIDGRTAARRLAHDARGLPLPEWRGCVTLAADEVFLLTADAADSFDGRYFGPVSRGRIMGVAVKLWPG